MQILDQKTTISELIESSRLANKSIPDGVQINIDKPNILSAYMRHFLKRNPSFHPAYIEVADWLRDNKRKGLWLHGMCSQGKTLLSRFVIPAILEIECHKICHFYTAAQANKEPDEVMKWHILSIDDVGCEDVSVLYGNRRNVFDEIMDDVEKKGKLIIVTSNLTNEQVSEKYGSRTMERLLACCRDIRFEMKDSTGKPMSFRNKQ